MRVEALREWMTSPSFRKLRRPTKHHHANRHPALIDGKETFVNVPPPLSCSRTHCKFSCWFGFVASNFDAVLLDVDSTSTVNFVSDAVSIRVHLLHWLAAQSCVYGWSVFNLVLLCSVPQHHRDSFSNSATKAKNICAWHRSGRKKSAKCN